MKIQELKQKVYHLTQTTNTKDLKKSRPELVQGKDLRRKDSWNHIFQALSFTTEFEQDQIEKDIKQKYGFQELSNNPSFSEIMGNLAAVKHFSDDLNQNFQRVSKKNNLAFEE